jgi:hypothetical protein
MHYGYSKTASMAVTVLGQLFTISKAVVVFVVVILVAVSSFLRTYDSGLQFEQFKQLDRGNMLDINAVLIGLAIEIVEVSANYVVENLPCSFKASELHTIQAIAVSQEYQHDLTQS